MLSIRGITTTNATSYFPLSTTNYLLLVPNTWFQPLLLLQLAPYNLFLTINTATTTITTYYLHPTTFFLLSICHKITPAIRPPHTYILLQAEPYQSFQVVAYNMLTKS